MFRILLYTLLTASTLFAQIPNAGFEEWTGTEPNGWETINSPGFFMPVEKTTDSHSGNSALKGSVTSFSDIAVTPLVSAYFPMDSRPAAIKGYYKFQSASDDIFIGALYFYNKFNVIAYAEIILDPSSGYKAFSIPVEYFDETIPDTCFAEFFIADTINNEVNPGSVFYLDDLSFGPVSNLPGLESIPPFARTFDLVSNFPNPFNPQTRIQFNMSRTAAVSLKIYDNNGKLVQELFRNDVLTAGKHEVIWDAANYPSGIYFYRLSDGSSTVISGKMTLLK